MIDKITLTKENTFKILRYYLEKKYNCLCIITEKEDFNIDVELIKKTNISFLEKEFINTFEIIFKELGIYGTSINLIKDFKRNFQGLEIKVSSSTVIPFNLIEGG